MLVSRFGFDKVPTNVPTKRRDVSEQLANVGGHSIVVGYWKIVKNIVPADDDEWLRTLADQRCGGPGRTRTCNQTVMSGGISISFVDFTVILFDPVRIRCASIGLILVRNWCGPRLATFRRKIRGFEERGQPYRTTISPAEGRRGDGSTRRGGTNRY